MLHHEKNAQGQYSVVRAERPEERMDHCRNPSHATQETSDFLHAMGQRTSQKYLHTKDKPDCLAMPRLVPTRIVPLPPLSIQKVCRSLTRPPAIVSSYFLRVLGKTCKLAHHKTGRVGLPGIQHRAVMWVLQTCLLFNLLDGYCTIVVFCSDD